MNRELEEAIAQAMVKERAKQRWSLNHFVELVVVALLSAAIILCIIIWGLLDSRLLSGGA